MTLKQCQTIRTKATPTPREPQPFLR